MTASVIDLTTTTPSPEIIIIPSDDDEKQASPRKRQKRTHDDESSPSDLFYVDITPGNRPAVVGPIEKPKQQSSLLLPAHVSVFGVDLVEIVHSDEKTDDDFIEYLDIDGRKDLKRYWEDPEPEKLTKILCKACGAEGKHKTFECPVKICLTCGARDEHSTFSCPSSKTCFACGMKGHLRSNCPNPSNSAAFRRRGSCDRCDGNNHTSNECPTLWRAYVYVAPAERERILSERHLKADMKLGEGGEGYIAQDHCCYHCGNFGHLGDDCEENNDPPADYSAFSKTNFSNSPFYDASQPNTTNARRPRPNRDISNDRWDTAVPESVGKRGKQKSIATLKIQEERRGRESDDWFEKATAGPPKKRGGEKGNQPGQRKMIKFGDSVQQSMRWALPPKPALSQRLSDKPAVGRARDLDGHRSPHSRSSRSDGRHDVGGRYKQKRRDSGPRYTGGYSRA